MKIRSLVAVATLLAAAAIGCAKNDDQLSYGEDPETTTYEVFCATQPPPPPEEPWRPQPPAYDWPLPEQLPKVSVPIEVKSCDALGEPPNFNNRVMPGLAAVVDCNARVVRFKSRDWQVNEAAMISPSGTVDMRIMYITRLLRDIDNDQNCWIRLLGHIHGTAQCPPSDPAGARLNFTVEWTFDEMPPEIMEPASPGQADLRNGKRCKIRPGNCLFVNEANMGCGG
jgi:hypothetical protein